MTTQKRKTAAEKKAEAVALEKAQAQAVADAAAQAEADAAAKTKEVEAKNPVDSVDKTVETAMKLNDALTPEAPTSPEPTAAEKAAAAAINPLVGTDTVQAVEFKAQDSEQPKQNAPTFLEKLEEIAAEAKAEADADVAAQAEEFAALTPLQLRVKNNGARAVCHVTQALIAANETTIITYSSIEAKTLAQGNFAQINALKGVKRFEIEG